MPAGKSTLQGPAPGWPKDLRAEGLQSYSARYLSKAHEGPLGKGNPSTALMKAYGSYARIGPGGLLQASADLAKVSASRMFFGGLRPQPKPPRFESLVSSKPHAQAQGPLVAPVVPRHVCGSSVQDLS